MLDKNEPNGARKDKEAAIFTAACKVIREKGFHQARMGDIAQAAGISYGLVYHYFKSKAELFDAVMGEWWRGLDEVTDGLAEDDRPVEKKLEAIVSYFLDQYQERPDLVYIYITEYVRSTANLTPERLDRIKSIMALTEAVIRKAQEQGAIRSDLKARYLTYFFLGSIEALISAMVFDDRRLKGNQLKNRLCEAVLAMFLEGARPSK